MTDVLYVVGARPNFMKVAPVFHKLNARLPSARQVIVHTGQHYDREMSDIFVSELNLPEPDHWLGVGSAGHGAQVGRALERVEQVLLSERPQMVVVAGDVNSTLAGALAAIKLGIPVAHIEAGLRSFDRTMPEEINPILDVKTYSAGLREFLCYARGKVAFQSLSPEVEARAEPRRGESGQADGCAERVDALHRRPPPAESGLALGPDAE